MYPRPCTDAPRTHSRKAVHIPSGAAASLLLLLFDLRLVTNNHTLLAEQYVFASAQAACFCYVVVGPRPEVFTVHKGPRPVSIPIKEEHEAGEHSHLRSQLGILSSE